MHWGAWVGIGVAAAVLCVLLGCFIYFRRFGKRVSKASEDITKLLDNGLMQAFRENKPYEEVRQDYEKLIDLLDIYSEYMHMLALREERQFERQNEYLILQYVEEDGEKVARLHFRTFPIRNLMSIFKPKEMLNEAFILTEQILYNHPEVAYMEFVTHNLLLSESVVKKLIERNHLKLRYTYNGNFENRYMPWIFSEWLMIHGGDNPKSKEVYEDMRRMNQPVQFKIYRA